MRNLLRRCGNEPAFGVEVGTRYHALMHGTLGLAWGTSRTFREMIDITVRYIDLGWAFTSLTLTEVDGTAVLTVEDADIPADVQPFLVERISGAAKTIPRDILSVELPFTAVRYRHAAPEDTSRYREIFGVEPTFDAASNCVCFDAEFLDRPLPQANEWVRAGYEQACRELLTERRSRTGVAGAVRDALVRLPGRIPDSSAVARELGMSPRTLFRRLDEEGTSFRVLVDEVRETLAEKMLDSTLMTTEQVARRLGYAEPASFVRAFKRWKGHTPQAFRTQAQTVRSAG